MISWCRAVVYLFLLLCVPSGCVAELDGYERDGQDVDDACDEAVEVRFDVRKTRSSIAPDESEIVDINLYAFCDGRLVAEGYFEYGDLLTLKLLYGHRYNLYALANVAEIDACLDEKQFLRECVCVIPEIKSMERGLPMVWRTEGFVVDSWADRVSLEFSRLVSKVFFSIDKDALKGLEINSVRVCQNPTSVWPFRFSEGSRVSDEKDVADGDYASADDLRTLNDGGRICFYVLENCQGRLLDGNTDPWAKTPESILGYEGLCSYLEVECTFRDGYFYSGDVTYRMYLGNDCLTDFNVKGNSVLNVSLFLTDDSLKTVSWRVEADVSVNDGYAGGWQSSGLHSIDDLYVGERFTYTIWAKDEMMTHLDGDIGNARLCAFGEDGEDITGELLSQGEFRQVGYDAGIRSFEMDMLCTGFGNGTLCLVDEGGDVLAVMDDLIIQKPKLRPSEGPLYDASEIVQADVGRLELPINADEQYFYLYLVDNEGYNLNSSRGCGFELSLFDPSVEVRGDDLVKDVFISRIQPGESGNDGPLASIFVQCLNDGSSQDRNVGLVDFITQHKLADVILKEDNFTLEGRLRMSLENLPVTLTLVDNGWAGYADCQISMIADNPSNLPLDVLCWQLNFAKDSYNAITRNEIVDLYGKEFIRECYDYVCGAYSPGLKPIYCSSAFARVGKSGIYPLPGISTDAIFNCLQYDYLGQAALSHHIDVSFENGARINGAQVVDNLSDGSMAYNIIYGTPDGWNDRGIWLYSAGSLISKPRNDFDALSGVTPRSMEDMESGMMGEISVFYDSGTNNFYAAVTSSYLSGIVLNVEIDINASGYVQTTPNGTWGKKVDNYCTSRVSRQVKDIVLGQTSIVVDGNAMNEAMSAIYAQTFFDSYNKVGSSNSYNHSAHPTSLEVSLRFSLSGDWADRMVPIKVIAPSVVSFFHEQEWVTYSVSVKTDSRLNRMAFVLDLKK